MAMEALPDDVVSLLDERYRRHGCLYFATAVSQATGLSVGVMDAPQAGTLGHAFLVIEEKSDRNRTKVLDVSGVMTVADVRREFLGSHGRLVWRPGGPLEDIPPIWEPAAVMVAVARRLPWTAPWLDPAATDDPAGEIRAILAAVRTASRGIGQPDWRAALRFVENLDGQSETPKHGL